MWNDYRDETTDDENKNDDNGNKINNNKTTGSKYFKYQAKIIGSTPNNENRLNAEVVALNNNRNTKNL